MLELGTIADSQTYYIFFSSQERYAGMQGENACEHTLLSS